MITTLLPAGRELDALVAEKVMGIVWPSHRCRVCGWLLVQEGGQGCLPDNCSERPQPKRRADEPAPYSTDIARAWQVHLAMCDRLFSLRTRYLDELKHQAQAVCGVSVAWPDVLVVLRERFPEAICNAALFAVDGAR